jgi:MFS family permease
MASHTSLDTVLQLLLYVPASLSTTKLVQELTQKFYYGYIVAVLPFALLFARLPLARTAGIIVLIWGIVCILTVVCDNYPGFVVQRVALGVAESAVSPAFVAITALWYKPREQAARLGIWYSATGVSAFYLSVHNRADE